MIARSPASILAAAMVIMPLAHGGASPLDPHRPSPQCRGGVWFEGWYARLTPAHHNTSYGLVVGYALRGTPPHPAPASRRPTFVGIIEGRHGGGDGECERTQTYDAFPGDVTVTQAGRPVTHDPDPLAPPDFAVECGERKCLLNVTSFDAFELVASAGDAVLEISSDGALAPWGKPGDGPEGPASRLPLPLHWYVHSTATPVRYRYTAPGRHGGGDGGGVRREGRGWLHMEKNWGAAFPPAWVWAQGTNVAPGAGGDGGGSNSSSGGKGSGEPRSYFSLAGGQLPLPHQGCGGGALGALLPRGLPLPDSWLLGYRARRADGAWLAWDFAPWNAVFYTDASPCAASFQLTAVQWGRMLQVDIEAPLRSFAPVPGPTAAGGFARLSDQSYAATARVRAYTRRGGPLGAWRQQGGEEVFRGAALEFGGRNRCSGAASASADAGRTA